MSPKTRSTPRSIDFSLIPAATRELMAHVTRYALEADVPLYLAGGVVRDLLLEKPVQDLDLVVEGNAIPFARSLAKAHGGRVTIHPKFGTATWVLPLELTGHGMTQNTLDFATARTETYEQPGALPTVTPSTLRNDLKRRDFTINAMAVRLGTELSGEVIDPYGGSDDLDKGLVRILHSSSFLDDPTRMFRAIRYARRYGFELAQPTRRLFNGEAQRILSMLSGERIRHELEMILDESHADLMLQDAEALYLLATIHPALRAPGGNFMQLLESIPDPRLDITFDRRALGFLLWLTDLSPADLREVCKRLDFNAALCKFLTAASDLQAEMNFLKGSPPSRWTPRLDRVPPLAVYAMYLRTEEPALANYLVSWRNLRPDTDGNDLARLGLTPGPAFKKILARLRAAWLDEEVTSHDEEIAFLDTLLKR